MGNEKLLILRSRCIRLYKTYEKWFIAMGKYLGVVWLLALISNKIGYVEILTKSYVILGIGFISMLLPAQYIVLFVMSIVAIHLLGFNLLLGGVVSAAFIIVYFGYIRLYPKESILIILTMIAFSLRCEYMIPVLAALFGGYSCVVAMTLGIVAIYGNGALGVIIQNLSVGLSFSGMVEQLTELLISTVFLNPTMLGSIIIFWIVFSIVYFIRKQSIDYAPYIAIAVGGVMNLLGFGLAILFLKVQVNIVMLVVMSLVSVVVAIIAQAFATPLDYGRTETVQFEDEENVYYVKVVPKLTVHLEPKKVEQIYTMNQFEEKEIL